jgi:hypothetical protein
VAASNGGNGGPTGRLLGLHGPWRNESVLESRGKSPLLVGSRSSVGCPSHHPPKPVRAPDSPASPSGTTPNLRRENAPPVVDTLSPCHSSWEMLASESNISHERSSSSTAGMEARIQRRTLPAVGWSVLLGFFVSLEEVRMTTCSAEGQGVRRQLVDQYPVWFYVAITPS